MSTESWASKNVGAVVTVVVLSAGVVASYAVAQFQIKDLRAGQESINGKLDQMPPMDTQRRIERLEGQLRSIEQGQSQMQTDIGIVRAIVERIEKKQ
jgi:hypothetical protein